MGSAYWITGDTLDTLRQLPDGCIDVVITSPPFLALRSYLPADDPAKAHEIGQEGSPGAFIDVLLDITEELRRVLAPHGSICVELGDTYSGSGGAGGDYSDEGLRDGQPVFRQIKGDGWPDAKSACLIPELYRISLAYGMNPLTGRTTPRWRVRNTVRWVRPNPPVGALGDKFRPATSDMVIATMARDRYFDLDAVREPGNPAAVGNQRNGKSREILKGGEMGAYTAEMAAAGAPPLDWWEIPTHPYKGSHYATFPPALVEKPVKAMCPQRVCTVCGKPSERIVEAQRCLDGEPVESAQALGDDKARRRQEGEPGNWRWSTERTEVGWTDCGHDSWRNGRVLDIFGGSGTTLAVATGHGRDAIGIDLDIRNVDLARDRIGPMFFEHVTVAELIEAFS